MGMDGQLSPYETFAGTLTGVGRLSHVGATPHMLLARQVTSLSQDSQNTCAATEQQRGWAFRVAVRRGMPLRHHFSADRCHGPRRLLEKERPELVL